MTPGIPLASVKHPFFIGIAGVGMSAIAQYLQGGGMQVSGSDRFFNENKALDIKEKLEAEGIQCFKQDGQGITEQTDLVVASTAIEDSVIEIRQARAAGIPVIRRSELLALIAAEKKTIAIGGTSGKSTTAAMLYHILQECGYSPSIITGAGLTSILEAGKIGNAAVGQSSWLIIEADESDGSIVQYHPWLGLLLNIEKDHKEIGELRQLFEQFRDNSQQFSVNRSNEYARELSVSADHDFGYTDSAGQPAYLADHFEQSGFSIKFRINQVSFSLALAGQHNMENALAATAAAGCCGIKVYEAAAALSTYKGIYRRNQVLGQKNGVWFIDDFAHNPAKCAAAIRSCQPVSDKVIAWFQPHGYTPTKFLRTEFVRQISEALRDDDEIWMSEIFYAGGTTTKDISAADLIEDIRATGKNAFFVADRNVLLEQLRPHLDPGSVLLLMGARDPSLEGFAKNIYENF